MKKLLGLASIAVISFSLAALGWIHRPIPHAAAALLKLEFEGFPLDEPQTIYFSAERVVELEEEHASDDVRMQRLLDQMRDWCLLTVISSSTLPLESINESVYDLPTIRDENLRRVADFDHGGTRSRVLGAGHVVALIPVSGDDQKRRLLGRIADEQRANLGAVPASIEVFEYELFPEARYAEVVRRASIPGEALFGPDYGYVTRDVRNVEDLGEFMAAIDDLSFAEVGEDGLILAGRVRQNDEHTRIGESDAAVIWRGQQGLPEYQGCGFSLDPHLDLTRMEELINKLRTALPEELVVELAKVFPDKPADDINEMRMQETLVFHSLVTICEMTVDPEPCLKAMRQLVMDHSYQTARYDGRHLAGTEVGMVLFYTDLLMKLWSFDYADSSPHRLPGFPIQRNIQVSPVFQEEFEAKSETRLWLEPLEEGYYVASDGRQLSFAPTATRVSARPHDSLRGRDLSDDPDPNVVDRMFVEWFNDHYEEIAAFEPMYQRLNQIIKWSILVSWLDLAGQSPRLEFLADRGEAPIAVSLKERFPQWVRQQESLSFTNWDSIQFLDSTRLGTDNEALEVLSSPMFTVLGGPVRWQGGVSLSRRVSLRNRTRLSMGLDDVSAGARRSTLNGSVSDSTRGTLRWLDGREVRFNNLSRDAVSTFSRARPSARLRSAFGEMRNMGFTREIRRTADGVVMQTRAARIGFGDLRISRGSSGFKVAWRSRDLDLGQSLARQISMKDPLRVLSRHHEVEAVVELGQRGGYLAKVRGTDTWIKLRPAGPGQGIRESVHARVAGLSKDARSIDVTWLDRTAVHSELQAAKWIDMPAVGRADTGVTIVRSARAPPAGAVETHIIRDGIRVPALRGDTGRLFVRVEDIPPAFRSNPSRLIEGKSALQPLELRLARRFESGQYRELAHDLATNHRMFRARTNRVITEEMQQCNRLIETGRMTEALERTDVMIRTYGRVPDLTYRKALLEVGGGNARSAAGTLNRTSRQQLGNAGSFYDEVNFRLAASKAPVDRANLYRTAEYAEWRAMPSPTGQVRAVGQGERLHLELRVSEAPRGRAVSGKNLAQSLAGRERAVYIQDSPGLHNLDPYTPAGQSSIQQLISGGRVTAHELRLADVSHFRPETMVHTTTGVSWRLAGGSIGLNAMASGFRRFAETDDSEEQEDAAVYLISSNTHDSP